MLRPARRERRVLGRRRARRARRRPRAARRRARRRRAGRRRRRGRARRRRALRLLQRGGGAGRAGQGRRAWQLAGRERHAVRPLAALRAARRRHRAVALRGS